MTKKEWKSYSTNQAAMTAVKRYLPSVTTISSLVLFRNQLKELLVERQLEIENAEYARQQKSHNASPDKYP